MFEAWTELEDAVGDRRFTDALRLAVDAWTSSRARELGDLVDAVARSITSPPPTSHHSWQTQRAWLAAIANPDPIAFGGVLQAIDRDLPLIGDPRTAERYSNDLWRERVEALIARPPDPRIAPRLVRSLSDLPPSNVTTTLAPLFVALADVRIVDDLRARSSDLSSAELARAASEIEAHRHPPLDEARRADVARWTERLDAEWTAIHRRADALLEAILEDPDDEAARAVHRDVLLETDDPRASLLALQLDTRHRAASSRSERIDSLVAAHEERWIGHHLVRVLDRRVFRLGLLDDAVLRARGSANAAGWEAAMRDPRLATLRRLGRGSASADEYLAFLRSPALRGLRVIEGSETTFHALAHHTLPRVTDVEITLGRPEVGFFPLFDASDPALPALRRVTIVTLPWTDFETIIGQLLRSKIVSRLDDLAIEVWNAPNSTVARFIAMLDEARVVPRARFRTTHATVTVTWPASDRPLDALVESDNGLGLAVLSQVRRLGHLTVQWRGAPQVRRLLKPGVIATRIDRLAPSSSDLPPEWTEQIARSRARR